MINLIEPFIVYGLILTVMWTSDLNMKDVWMFVEFGILLLWALFLSPWWHYSKLNEKEIFLRPEQRNFWFWFFECRGMGSFKKYYMKDENGVRGYQEMTNTEIRK